MEDDEVMNNIININNDIEELLDKDEIDEERLFKLRYAQMIQGLYLNNMNINK